MADNQFDDLTEVFNALDEEGVTCEFSASVGSIVQLEATNLDSELYDEIRITLYSNGTWNYGADKSKRKAFFDEMRKDLIFIEQLDDSELASICEHLGVKLP